MTRSGILMGPRRRGDLAGQSLVEYGSILLFIALAVVGALTLLGNSAADFYQSVVGLLPGS